MPKFAKLFLKDSKPKCRALPQPLTKIHQVQYVKVAPGAGDLADILALSTEDGRIMFYSTNYISDTRLEGNSTELSIPSCPPLGQLGGKTAGLSGRIKDFQVLDLPSPGSRGGMFLIVSGSSDGSIRLWMVAQEDLSPRPYGAVKPPTEDTVKSSEAKSNGSATNKESPTAAREVGRLIGTYETGNRITCLKAFVMSGPPEDSFSEDEVGTDHELDVEKSDESGSS